MARVVVVEIDEKGRLLIPPSLRRELKSRRFTVSVKGGRLVMEPVKPPDAVRGKYKGLLKVGIEELEEAQERFVFSKVPSIFDHAGKSKMTKDEAFKLLDKMRDEN